MPSDRPGVSNPICNRLGRQLTINGAGNAIDEASVSSGEVAFGDGMFGFWRAFGWQSRSASVKKAVKNGTPALGCVARWAICRWMN